MNKLLNELRLRAGIARLEDGKTIVCVNRNGNIIDPLEGLEQYGGLIINHCVDIVLSCDPSSKMIAHEPYRTIINKIFDSFDSEDENDN